MGDEPMTKQIKIIPKALEGAIEIPPSKSMSHRGVIAAGLADGESQLDNVLYSDDIVKTLGAMEGLGASILQQIEKNTIAYDYKIQGGRKVNKGLIDCKESGSTLRFLIPIALTNYNEITFKGSGKLVERPLDIYYDLFKKQGIYYENDAGKLPLTIKGQLEPGKFQIRGDVSSQFISGLLMALPLLDGDSQIEITTDLESRDYVEMTLDVLEKFGIIIEKESRGFLIKGNQVYQPTQIYVEGDYSQGAFWAVAGLLGKPIELKGLAQKTSQGDQRILEIIKAMGGKIEWQGDSLVSNPSSTKGQIIDASQCPDLVPILATLAALSEGETQIINAGRLRIKESDRLKAITEELNQLGAKISEYPDKLIIEGVSTLRGGKVKGWNDHRIVMALAIAAIRCEEEVWIEGYEAVSKSYPTFWMDYKRLGGVIYE